MKPAALALLMLLPYPAIADVTIHTVSVHLATSGMNNFNPGIGYDIGPVRVGGLYNSYKRPGFYAIAIAPITPRFRVGAGVISGYRFDSENRVLMQDDNHFIPYIAAEYDISKSWSVAWFGEVLNIEYKF